ncbi:MAG: hypothetical protein COX82_02115 [Candidatus Magasanikbacteria bacterium CG_4_10_14_0_2_um_filter_41_10]|uniref:Uncharacterized protein n=1 Tax=Candidatus Magasanikbacteria bacterium CG_4_10_14_0_2_um_filter_41_10 TaxID=1974638 RepID=A0A2M7V590_9BACT|nr:MAG: hypothetical protein COX82_02115 [Candidatus Magasanikbacteria bacterium CG_4_10_14_0_2_um_filter_41_10]
MHVWQCPICIFINFCQFSINLLRLSLGCGLCLRQYDIIFQCDLLFFIIVVERYIFYFYFFFWFFFLTFFLCFLFFFCFFQFLFCLCDLCRYYF